MPKEAKPRAAKIEKETKSKPEKKVKDPNAPKRPLSAYMYFSSAQRATVKEENPAATFGTFSLMTIEWRGKISDATRLFLFDG